MPLPAAGHGEHSILKAHRPVAALQGHRTYAMGGGPRFFDTTVFIDNIDSAVNADSSGCAAHRVFGGKSRELPLTVDFLNTRFGL